MKVPMIRLRVPIVPRRFNSSVHDRMRQVAELVKSDPELKASFIKMEAIFREKGFIGDKPPSFIQLSKMLMDPEVRSSLSILQQKIQEANIQINPSDFSELMKQYKKE